MDTKINEVQIRDVHTHPYFLRKLHHLRDMADYFHMDKYNVLSLSSHFNEYIVSNLACMLVKLESEGRGYAFGSLQYPQTGMIETSEEIMSQMHCLLDMGFDGIKMLEGKPTSRKRIGAPLNDERYFPMFEYLEEHDIPVLYHVNDPAEFWDPEKIPDWAREVGWLYFDGTYPSKEQIEEEALDIVRRFPKLRMIFAHMFFDSDNYPRACQILDEHPNLYLDICPGIEMYQNFVKDPELWHDFFEKYADRILYGTDTVYDTYVDKVESIFSCLSDGSKAAFYAGVNKGLHLSKETLQKVMGGNFLTYLDREPKPVNVARVLEFAKDLRKFVETYDNTPFYQGQIDGLVWQIEKYK